MTYNDHLEWVRSRGHNRCHSQVYILIDSMCNHHLNQLHCSMVVIKCNHNQSPNNIRCSIFYKSCCNLKPSCHNIYPLNSSTNIKHNDHLYQQLQRHSLHFHLVHSHQRNLYNIHFHQLHYNFKEVLDRYCYSQDNNHLRIRYKQAYSHFCKKSIVFLLSQHNRTGYNGHICHPLIQHRN